MLSDFTVRQNLGLILLAATATVGAAWAFQLLGGYVPCPLCLQQRWPYYIAIMLALLMLLFGRPEQHGRLALYVIAALMLLGAGLGAYHAGVEWKFWPGPRACATGGGLSGGLPDLATARVIACDEAQWRFLGLSFAGWNVVISLVLAAFSVWGARRAYGSSSASQ